MNILLNQEFEVNSIISQSDRFSADKFQKIIQDMIIKYKNYADGSNEYMITTTRSVEVLLPISNRIAVENPYVLKRKSKL